MIPAAQAILSLLGLKLFGNARHSHVMSYVMDEGLALFAGLNVIPKRSFLTEYSCRINPTSYPEIMRRWFDAVGRIGLKWGQSFDLDFHTIPFHGEDALFWGRRLETDTKRRPLATFFEILLRRQLRSAFWGRKLLFNFRNVLITRSCWLQGSIIRMFRSPG